MSNVVITRYCEPNITFLIIYSNVLKHNEEEFRRQYEEETAVRIRHNSLQGRAAIFFRFTFFCDKCSRFFVKFSRHSDLEDGGEDGVVHETQK
jgi:hypothetical protein